MLSVTLHGSTVRPGATNEPVHCVIGKPLLELLY